jgi:hypothetical protein
MYIIRAELGLTKCGDGGSSGNDDMLTTTTVAAAANIAAILTEFCYLIIFSAHIST